MLSSARAKRAGPAATCWGSARQQQTHGALLMRRARTRPPAASLCAPMAHPRQRLRWPHSAAERHRAHGRAGGGDFHGKGRAGGRTGDVVAPKHHVLQLLQRIGCAPLRRQRAADLRPRHAAASAQCVRPRIEPLLDDVRCGQGQGSGPCFVHRQCMSMPAAPGSASLPARPQTSERDDAHAELALNATLEVHPPSAPLVPSSEVGANPFLAPPFALTR